MDFKEAVTMADKLGAEYWIKAEPLSVSHPERDITLEFIRRDRDWQIERVTVAPFGVVPLHRHPLVDSYEFPLWGEGEIWLGAHKYKLCEGITPWRPLFISRRTWHGGCGYERGGAFLSVQHWHAPISGHINASWENKP